ncbi:IclR family transcriptional regulator domain-containing protein [Halocatena marina]
MLLRLTRISVERPIFHNTSLGNTTLTNLPREHVMEIFDRHGMPASTENTITDRDEIFDELERVRENDIH